MNTYELTRIVPPAWEYDASLLTLAAIAALVVAVSPFAVTLLRSALRCFIRPCGDSPSLPATPVKPRLA